MLIQMLLWSDVLQAYQNLKTCNIETVLYATIDGDLFFSENDQFAAVRQFPSLVLIRIFLFS